MPACLHPNLTHTLTSNHITSQSTSLTINIRHLRNHSFPVNIWMGEVDVVDNMAYGFQIGENKA